jgi:hypothetical protein
LRGPVSTYWALLLLLLLLLPWLLLPWLLLLV